MEMEHLIYQERRGTDSVKWDILGRKYQDPNLLGMWIADMDFRAPECVIQALRAYVDAGIYGYYLQPADCRQAFIDWQRETHGAEVDPSWLRFAPGAVSGLCLCVSAMTRPGDVIAVMPPVYHAFFSVARKTGRSVAACPLRRERDRYEIDFQRLEECFRRDKARLLLHCSPHNPVGRVWTREEQRALLELCRKYGVFVLSDEVHQDLLMDGHAHFPLYSFKEFADMVICVTSPSKTFNLAGCQAATLVVPDEGNRRRVDAVLDRSGIEKGSSFSYVAYRAAYRGGRGWLDALLAKIKENEVLVRGLFARNAPRVAIAPLEGTYLLWIDFSALVPPEEMKTFVEKESGLAVNYGGEFGGDAYSCAIRMNLATSTENVALAAGNLISALWRRGLAAQTEEDGDNGR